ncbi:hypothetical protein EP331_00960 [bacterium]|nr:MAG: hypothetical protein EP331_00960 [bacterium]
MQKSKFVYLTVLSLLTTTCITLNPGKKSSYKSEADSLTHVPSLPENYDAVFPTKDPSPFFEDLSQIVKRIQVTLYYKTTYFSDEQNITPKMLRYQKPDRLSKDSHIFNFSKIGTAIPLDKNADGVLLMTCAHVVDVEDTVYSYRKGPNVLKDTYLNSVTVLQKVEYFIFESPKVHEFEIIAKAENSDLALIRSLSGATSTESVKILPYKLGNSKRLQWGSHIFMFGFPINNRMISHGIVSKPEKDGTNGFLTNAYMNKGFSGGLVVAVRGDVPNFEWVGVASAISSEYEYSIVPNKNIESYFESGQLYTDSLFLEKKLSINHGISKSVSSEEIKKFMVDSEGLLFKLSYNLTSFYSVED